MIIKYLSFIFGLIWSYSIIRTQSVFSKKAGVLFKIFISKISWFTFIAACYFGYKNFTFKTTAITIIVTIFVIHLLFNLLGNYLKNKIGEDKLLRIKTIFEYLLIVGIVYFVFF